MMRVEIEDRGRGKRALINLGGDMVHSIPAEKAAQLAVWIEELLPVEVAKARQPVIPDPSVRSDEPE